MKTEIRDKWVRALGSGDYEQGQGALRRRPLGGDEEWCCLGVLSDLAVQSGEIPGLEWLLPTDSTNIFTLATVGDASEGMPVQAVYDWAGLDEEDAQLLADINDNGCPFLAVRALIGAKL